MTGVAAQLCADRALAPKGARVGARRAVLGDLSPAATFIAAGTNADRPHSCPISTGSKRLVDERGARVRIAPDDAARRLGTEERSSLVGTVIPSVARSRGKIEYVVWSDVFLLPKLRR